MPCFIAPPDLLAYVIERGNPPEREAALRTIAASAALRAQRQLVGALMRTLDVDVGQMNLVPVTATGRRTVYDSEHGGRPALPGELVPPQGGPPPTGTAPHQAHDGARAPLAFYPDP